MAVQGDGQEFTQQVDILGYGTRDGYDGWVDVKLTVTTLGFSARSFGDTPYGPASEVRCVQLHVGGDDEVPLPLDCGSRPPILVPPAPPPAPALKTEPLRRALKSGSLEQVRAASSRGYPQLAVTATQVRDAVVVVVVRSEPEPSCLGGVRTSAGRVTVTRVPSPRPGEGDCDPSAFVTPPR